MDTVIKLIRTEYQQNDLAVDSPVETERDVLCRVRSVSRSDFYSAGQFGLALDHVFIINPVNYAGEKILEYNGERYGIERTYQARQDEMELYAGHKVGVANGLN